MLRGAQHWARRRKRSRQPDLGKVGNVGSPEGFTPSLRVEVGEQVMAELWESFGGRRCSVEHARACRSELATATPLRPSFWRERDERGNGRIHSLGGIAVEGMRASGADERGQGWCTGTKCRRCADAGWPRRRARRPFRHCDARLIEPLR